MKKVIVLIFVIASLLPVLCVVLFFVPTSYDLSELTEKFNVCYDGVEAIANKYNLENKFYITDEVKLLKSGYIKINNKSGINVEFSTNATKTQKSEGVFCVSYTISDIGTDNNFDIELFVELVNSISGKTITNDFVTDFLNAPEEKYSVEKYGLTGEGYAESKMYALDFFENWVIGYHLTYNNHAELWFRGRIQ